VASGGPSACRQDVDPDALGARFDRAAPGVTPPRAAAAIGGARRIAVKAA
jgi:hypothetical protein